jgi:hypothetical protein
MVAASQPTKPSEGRLDEEVVRPCLGVLFVHGAGGHGVGATLI